MAVLTSEQRAELFADLMRDLSRSRSGTGLTKADLRAALHAADQWAEDNRASYNTALPQPARSFLSAAQKARLLAAVLLRRFERGV